MKSKRAAEVAVVLAIASAASSEVAQAEPVPAADSGAQISRTDVGAAEALTVERADNVRFTGDRLTNKEKELFFWAHDLATDYWKQFGYPELCAEDLEVVFTQKFEGYTGPTPSGAVDAEQCLLWINSSPEYKDNPENLSLVMTRLYGLANGVDYSSDKNSVMYSEDGPRGQGKTPPKGATMEVFDEMQLLRRSQLKKSGWNRPGGSGPVAGI